MRLALPAGMTGHQLEPDKAATGSLRTLDTRARTVGYLATARVAAPGFRTDGVWVWPESLAQRARLFGQAPPPELYEHLRRSRFLLPDAVPEEVLVQATALAYSVQARAYVATEAPFLADASIRPGPADHRGQPAEDEPSGIAPRLARLFDAVSVSGTGRFTPDRLRIPEPVRRERLARYLDGGRLVLRVPGEVPDPLHPRYGLPLHYRTDGSWVWPQALAHYLRTRGVAPELELLCHIEERGYQLPAVADDEATAARAAIHSPRSSTPNATPTYLSGADGELIRVSGPAPGQVEQLREDLRWGPPLRSVDPMLRAFGFRVIDQEQAAAELDARWAIGWSSPPLN